jgi:monofunctional biosynthetic peptidoglycan transglycosylase
MRIPWRRVGQVLAALVLLDCLYLAWIWPSWESLAKGPAPKSAFIESYEASLARGDDIPPLRFQPVPLSRIARTVQRAVVVAEDSRFFQHDGVDVEALRDAIDENLEQRRIVLGGSTISQQTAKNLFLSPGRTPLRKWHELLLTMAMERHLEKRRILELYLNVAQFGEGVFGVEAAARHYWGTSAAALTTRQAAELAAALPSPVKHNPDTRTPRFERRVRKIIRFLARTSAPVADLGPAGAGRDQEGDA